MRISISVPSFVFGFILVAACGGTASESGGGDGGATSGDGGAVETSPGEGGGSNDGGPPACAIAYDQFNSSPKVNAQSTHAWTCTATSRIMTGNGIPDHAVVGGNFATPVGVQSLSVTFPLAPAAAAAPTTLVRKPSGYALNSVKLDPGTDGSCASTATSTAPGNGCVAIMGRDPWRLEAIGGAFKFGTDENNAHTQPNGQYHYHGMPEGLLAKAGTSVTLVGFAVDGFPIYARYGYSVATDPSSAIKVVTGSWQLKATPDDGRPDTTVFPMGTFTSDHEYVAGSGDLDECNGRTGVTPEFPQGTYHYYITDTYPFIQRCVKGSAP
ncbi:MAG TPA: YHYH protein [Labilithrix sp.]|nr:YHYH protein [Labilithrix sp.]